MSRAAAIAKATDHFDDGGFMADLARRVAIRTESQMPGARASLYAYLSEEMAPTLSAMGYETRLVENPVAGGWPFLIGRRIEDAALPTVLTYGHGDVVRGLEGQWKNGLDPWAITRDGDAYYGRGTADNKGQHSINLAALRTVLETRGKLGFNSVFMVDMGEEVGSPGLNEFCDQERVALKADLLIGSDGPRLTAERPTIFMGTRGAFNFDLMLDLRAGGHHSGNWGGLLANPGAILANAIATIIDKNGKILVRDLVPTGISAAVREALADCGVAPEPGGPTIDPWWGEPGLSAAEKVFGWNSFEVLAFKTGNPDNPVNAVPPTATAWCQMRFVVGTDPSDILPILRRHLDAHGFGAIKLAPNGGAARATRVEPDHPAAVWAKASIAATTGKKPAVLPNLGGTLPNDCFADTLGLPTLWVPHSYTSCNQHAPNEHVLGPVLREGLAMMTGLFWDMGEKPPRL
jgi:acetylornithine deacetylase/succinyl-diaminopimelate desuccinylase-like protein